MFGNSAPFVFSSTFPPRFPAASTTTASLCSLCGSVAKQFSGTTSSQTSTSASPGSSSTMFGGFGGASNTTGRFGLPQQQQYQQSHGVFGQNAPNTIASFGLQGTSIPTEFATADAGGSKGTTTKFFPPIESDTGATLGFSGLFQCITVMQPYQNKSFEELRLEDYLVNRKGQQLNILGTLGAKQPTLFGNNLTTSSSLGHPSSSFQQNADILQSSSSSSFRAPKADIFGGIDIGSFGSSQPVSSGGFFPPAFGFGHPKVCSGGFFGYSNQGIGPCSTQKFRFGIPSSSVQQNAGNTQPFSSSSLSTPNPIAFGDFVSKPNVRRIYDPIQQQRNSFFGQPQPNTIGLFGFQGMSFSKTFTPPGLSGSTTIFSPVKGTDTVIKNGVPTTIDIRNQCITVMKEYENLSLEELRYYDYLANRKGPREGVCGRCMVVDSNNSSTGSTSLFQSQSGFSFGASNASGGATCAPSTSTASAQSNQQSVANIFGTKSNPFRPTTEACLNSACSPSKSPGSTSGTGSAQNAAAVQQGPLPGGSGEIPSIMLSISAGTPVNTIVTLTPVCGMGTASKTFGIDFGRSMSANPETSPSNSSLMSDQSFAQLAQQQIPAYQQQLGIGNSITLGQGSDECEAVIKRTTPAAQRTSAFYQYKISAHPTPEQHGAVSNVSLIDGVNDTTVRNEGLEPKENYTKVVIKPESELQAKVDLLTLKIEELLKEVKSGDEDKASPSVKCKSIENQLSCLAKRLEKLEECVGEKIEDKTGALPEALHEDYNMAIGDGHGS